ncbi:hypothetical protein L1987_19821 [Smallanthus sonchifolius]|uniref:Uncharacterized protein n=1 Tax=Smallanthus sonchifolius TaxID=185202 RepID=A0ACB9IRX9_9ASTR|nr:hypothetical protein L1987_19821 [Smallanthus sonchifolius]
MARPPDPPGSSGQPHRPPPPAVPEALFLVIITMAIAITLTSTFIDEETLIKSRPVKPFPKWVSWFLAENNHPRAVDHCKRDDEICDILEGKNSTCCNNKCMDLSEDKHTVEHVRTSASLRLRVAEGSV